MSASFGVQPASYLDAIAHLPAGASLLLPGVSWEGYESLQEEVGESADLRIFYDEGKVAIVHGVGYDQPSFSHFTSSSFWHTAAPNSGQQLGWVPGNGDIVELQRRALAAHRDAIDREPGQHIALQAVDHDLVAQGGSQRVGDDRRDQRTTPIDARAQHDAGRDQNDQRHDDTQDEPGAAYPPRRRPGHQNAWPRPI